MAVGGIRVDGMSMLAPRRARAVLAAAGAALVTLVAVQAAFAEAPRTSFTVADQAAARAAVLRASDLGTGWTGTVKKSAVEGPTPCPGWSPRQADLVITGAAESQLSAQGVFVFSSALVYKSTRMIALDWQRTVVGLPVRCLAGQFTAGAGDQLKIVVADYQGNATGRVFVDAVLVGRGRTAASIGLVAPYAQRADADAAEIRLAKIVLARIKA
jgi:hypothetical protein